MFLASAKAELQSIKESELELRALVKSLQMEVETKNHDLQVMQKSLERLRKEKQLSYTTVIGMYLKCIFHFSPALFTKLVYILRKKEKNSPGIVIAAATALLPSLA